MLPHCPKNKLNLNIKTEPVMDVEDATVQNGHKWHTGIEYTEKSIPMHLLYPLYTGSVLYVVIQTLFGTAYPWMVKDCKEKYFPKRGKERRDVIKCFIFYLAHILLRGHS